MHAHRQVVLNVCGTQTSSVQDILMDVAGDAVPFLEGHAHGAMLNGAKNILSKVQHLILEGKLLHLRISGSNRILLFFLIYNF